MKASKIKKQKLLNIHVKWVWFALISLRTGSVITEVEGQVEHATDRDVDMGGNPSAHLRHAERGALLGSPSHMKAAGVCFKVRNASLCYACSVENSPGKKKNRICS